jgi:hypothetical protein
LTRNSSAKRFTRPIVEGEKLGAVVVTGNVLGFRRIVAKVRGFRIDLPPRF